MKNFRSYTAADFIVNEKEIRQTPDITITSQQLLDAFPELSGQDGLSPEDKLR